MRFQLIVILLSIFTIKTHAYIGAVSTATAGAGRAAIEPSDSPVLNPAGVAYIKGYHFTSSYSTLSFGPLERGQDFSLSLTDNLKDTLVPTSLVYTQLQRDHSDLADDWTTRELRVAFGYIFSPGWSLGVGVHQKDDQLPMDRFQQVNVDTGLLWAINESSGLALVVENLVNQKNTMPEAVRLRPTTALGYSYIYRQFVRFKVDLMAGSNNTFTTPVLAGGMESFLNNWMVLRLGTQRDYETASNLYGAGLGFIGPRFGLHYGYQTSSINDEKLARHAVDLVVPLW